MPPGDPFVASPSGAEAHQASRIDRPHRNPRADRGVDRGMQLRLVVDAVQPQAAGEINQRLLLVQMPSIFDGGLQSRQLAIRVEDVELAVVLTEGGAGIGAAGVGGRLIEALAFADDHRLDNAQQPSRSSVKSCRTCTAPPAILHDGHQIRGSHLRPDELLRRGERAQLIRHRHRRHVEIQRQQPAILVSTSARAPRARSACAGVFRNTAARRTAAAARRFGNDLVQLLIFEELDRPAAAPSSVTVKSFAVRPSTGLPLLSFTSTVSIFNCA